MLLPYRYASFTVGIESPQAKQIENDTQTGRIILQESIRWRLFLSFTQVQTEQRIQQVLDPHGTGHLQKHNNPGGIILLARLPHPSASFQTFKRLSEKVPYTLQGTYRRGARKRRGARGFSISDPNGQGKPCGRFPR